MKRSSFGILAGFGLCIAALHGADATSPVDYSQRNAPYAPASTVQPDSRRPQVAPGIQDRRVTPPTVERTTSPLGEQRAAIDVTEVREKNVREIDSRRPETVEQPRSQLNGQRSPFSTNSDTTKPPMVAKYQESLVAASASNMARFPAVGVSTSAKINRFVFRKNGADLANGAPGAAVTPAAGGSVPVK